MMIGRLGVTGADDGVGERRGSVGLRFVFVVLLRSGD